MAQKGSVFITCKCEKCMIVVDGNFYTHFQCFYQKLLSDKELLYLDNENMDIQTVLFSLA